MRQELVPAGFTGLLGVDGSPVNDPAVGFAFGQAALRSVPLVAPYVWAHSAPIGPGDMLPLVYEPAEVEADEERVLAEALTGWQGTYPDTAVHPSLRHGVPGGFAVTSIRAGLAGDFRP